MIFSVHFYYSRLNSRKMPSHFEGLVFASSSERAEELIREMLSGLPIKIEALTVAGPAAEKTLAEIYEERPELAGISPEEGYVYSRISQIRTIRKNIGFK